MKCNKDCKNFMKFANNDYLGTCKDYQDIGINLICLENSTCYKEGIVNDNKKPVRAKSSFCPVCNEPLYMFYYCVFCGQKVIRSKKDIKDYEKHNTD